MRALNVRNAGEGVVHELCGPCGNLGRQKYRAEMKKEVEDRSKVRSYKVQRKVHAFWFYLAPSQRCAVLGCSDHGPHFLSITDVESAATVGIKLKEKCRGNHLCDLHRLAIPGRHASAGASNIERAEEAKAEQTAENLAYAWVQRRV